MRIAIVDYSGHPFQVQLSRELARRAHDVLHLHFADFLTPKVRLRPAADDPASLTIEAVTLGRPFAKNSLLRRYFQEREVGRRFARRVGSFEPDVVVGCNLPLDSLRVLMGACRRSRRPFVFWQQDIYSEAISRILSRRLGLLGRLIGAHYRRLERKALQGSAEIVVIADDFVRALVEQFGIAASKAHVVENWAPLEDLTPRAKDNAWSRSQRLEGSKVVLYTGTLGMKHDAGKLLAIASAIKVDPKAMVVVASEGISADWLANEARANGLTNLLVLPFQPFEAYADVLASAEVLVALLEPDAGVFSVPSKVLSYLCSQRPIVLSAPGENLASRIIEKSGAGASVAPDDLAGLTDAIVSLLDDPVARERAARNGRRYAEKNFAIEPIGTRFEAILTRAAGARALSKTASNTPRSAAGLQTASEKEF